MDKWSGIKEVILLSGLVSLFTSLFSAFVGGKFESVIKLARDISASLFVGVLIGVYLSDKITSGVTIIIGVAVGALLAPGIIGGIYKISSYIKEDPLGLAERILNLVRGIRSGN